MPERDDDDQQYPIIDRVDNSIIAYAQPVGRAPTQLA